MCQLDVSTRRWFICFVFVALWQVKPHRCQQEQHGDHLHHDTGQHQHEQKNVQSGPHGKIFLKSLFKKYGNGDVITLEGFEHLVANLGLAGMVIQHEVGEHFALDGSFQNVDKNKNGGWRTREHDHNHDHHDHDHEKHEMGETDSGHNSSTSDNKPGAYGARQKRNAWSWGWPGALRRGDAASQRENQPQKRSIDSSVKEDSQCLSVRDTLRLSGIDLHGHHLTQSDFIRACPSLIQQLDGGFCRTVNKTVHVHDHLDHVHNKTLPKPYSILQIPFKVWGCALAAVFVISMVGLVAVALIPIMHRVFYNHLLQFLVALAVGSLTGDSLLHLIPHAMASSQGHDGTHQHGNNDIGHQQGVWRGMVILAGIYMFYSTERLMDLLSQWRRNRCKKHGKGHHHRKDKRGHKVKEDCGVKLYPKAEDTCDLGARLSNPTGTSHLSDLMTCDDGMMVVHADKDFKDIGEDVAMEDAKEMDQLAQNGHSSTDHSDKELGHSHHRHGHSHMTGNNSVSSVACMVIMGDGLHNFCDGMAIGAAFANSISGGLSTSLAVFCHELPHELGDFAVLLKTGMKPKQAILYNCLSSILCLLGMVIGVSVGKISEASLWIFALAAGMFIYIALVDMLPEMTTMVPKVGENPFFHLLLQNAGLLCGIGIMLVIAAYEDHIQVPHLEP